MAGLWLSCSEQEREEIGCMFEVMNRVEHEGEPLFFMRT